MPVIDFVIEHLEADEPAGADASAGANPVPEWVSLEYAHMLEVSPASSTVHFTSLSPSSVADFQRTLDKPRPAERAIAPGHGASAACHTDGILALLSSKNIPLSRCCLLDPKATEPVAPGDSELFDVFLFGGILGDDPPLDRTRILRREGFPSRHLGPVQMTTDTALAVTKRVVVDGIPLDALPFVNHPTISFSAKDAVEMPFRYLTQTATDRSAAECATGLEGTEGGPLMPRGMRDLLRRDLDRGWEFDNE